MVFQAEGQFQQLIHCKFRENAVRLLHIPTLEDDHVFLIVNKFGKVGLYEPERLRLLHTYLLDLSMPMFPRMTKKMVLMAKRDTEQPPPKCQRTHVVVDAIFAPDVKSVIYLTSKGILQCYDIGEIETQSYGLELFPRKRFMGLKNRQSPLELRNRGHVETHRVFGLSAFPTCMEYYPGNKITGKGQSDQKAKDSAVVVGRLFIGNVEGYITIISIRDPRMPFGLRKIRGVLHEINVQDLANSGDVVAYRAHYEPIQELKFITQRQLVLSCSRDRKFSLFVKDYTSTSEPYIISLPRGVNSFAHSDKLRVIATGSDDAVLRLFNQFVVKMPQVELTGHRTPIVSVQFLLVPFSDTPIVLSLSSDVELRAWDPLKYECLQAAYISFPIKSTIMCRSPFFGHHAIYAHLPNYEAQTRIRDDSDGSASSSEDESKSSNGKRGEDSKKSGIPECLPGRSPKKGQDGFLFILYCNSIAQLSIEKEKDHWPFDFEEFSAEFEEMGSKWESKLRQRQASVSKDPKRVSLSAEEVANIESKLDAYTKEILDLKRNVERQLSRTTEAHPPSLSAQTVQRLYSLKTANSTEAMAKADLLKEGLAFKSLPLVPLEPIQFHTPKLPVTEAMREVGIDEVQSVDDLLTKKSFGQCFSGPNMEQKVLEAEMLEKAFDLDEEQKHIELFGYMRDGTLCKDDEDLDDGEDQLADEAEYLKQSLELHRLANLNVEDDQGGSDLPSEDDR